MQHAHVLTFRGTARRSGGRAIRKGASHLARARRARRLAIVAVTTGALSGCGDSGPGGETTCAQRTELDRPGIEIVTEGVSDEQKDIMTRMLRDHDKDDGPANQMALQTEILQFCLDEDNAESPIDDGADWS